jgi:predicted RNA-binding protein YlqC (UPF0109 family)
MKPEKMKEHILKTMGRYTTEIHKKYGGESLATMRISAIKRRLGHMFGVSEGRIIYAMRQLVTEGKVIRHERGGNPVYSLP